MLKRILSWIGGIIGILITIPIIKILLGLIACVLIMILYAFSWAIGNTESSAYQYEFEIQAMKDNVTYIQGRYDTDSELKYYFVRDGDVGWVDSSNSTVVEDGQNKIVVYASQPKIGKELWHKAVDLLWQGEYPFEKEYEIHVPQNSITEEFNIDLE